MKLFKTACILALSLALGAPLTAQDLRTEPPRRDGLQIGMYQEGEASYYAERFHGEYTASGEIFDMYAMTAAHKTLPFGTVVSVSNLNNGKTVNLRINDRGPFIKGRIIDVSKVAAQRLQMIASGVVKAKIVIVSLPKERNSTQKQVKTKTAPQAKGAAQVAGPRAVSKQTPNQKRFAIQIASYKELKYAQIFYQRLNDAGIPVHFETHGGYYRLIVGNLRKEQIPPYLAKIKRQGFPNVLVRREE